VTAVDQISDCKARFSRIYYLFPKLRAKKLPFVNTAGLHVSACVVQSSSVYELGSRLFKHFLGFKFFGSAFVVENSGLALKQLA